MKIGKYGIYVLLVGISLLMLQGSGNIEQGNPSDYIRLHVRANSNEEIDQQVKLSVRDGILYYLQELEQCTSLDEAKQRVEGKLVQITEVAEKILAEEGFTYSAVAQLTVEEFPDRQYGDLFLPAGEYLALQVILGEGTGDNWWCVLYPPLCYGHWEPSVESDDDAIIVYADKEDSSQFLQIFQQTMRKIFI